MKRFWFFLTLLLSASSFAVSEEFTAAEITSLSGHTDDVRSLSFSPDENYLASASNDNTVRIRMEHFSSVAVMMNRLEHGNCSTVLFTNKTNLSIIPHVLKILQ